MDVEEDEGRKASQGWRAWRGLGKKRREGMEGRKEGMDVEDENGGGHKRHV